MLGLYLAFQASAFRKYWIHKHHQIPENWWTPLTYFYLYSAPSWIIHVRHHTLKIQHPLVFCDSRGNSLNHDHIGRNFRDAIGIISFSGLVTENVTSTHLAPETEKPLQVVGIRGWIFYWCPGLDSNQL